MAKKKSSAPAPSPETSPSATPPARARRAPRRKASSGGRSDGAAAAEPVATAEDWNGAGAALSGTQAPSYEEIAEAAYHRFLQRGGTDGRDFDDWIEAEQALRRANR